MAVWHSLVDIGLKCFLQGQAVQPTDRFVACFLKSRTQYSAAYEALYRRQYSSHYRTGHSMPPSKKTSYVKVVMCKVPPLHSQGCAMAPLVEPYALMYLSQHIGMLSCAGCLEQGGGRYGRRREVLEWPYTAGGGGVPPRDPPLQTKVTIMGKNEIYHWESLVWPFLVHNLLGPRPPPPLLPPPS